VTLGVTKNQEIAIFEILLGKLIVKSWETL